MQQQLDINALNSTFLVGLCPCHGSNIAPGRTGGFYHLACRHGVSFYFILLAGVGGQGYERIDTLLSQRIFD